MSQSPIPGSKVNRKNSLGTRDGTGKHGVAVNTVRRTSTAVCSPLSRHHGKGPLSPVSAGGSQNPKRMKLELCKLESLAGLQASSAQDSDNNTGKPQGQTQEDAVAGDQEGIRSLAQRSDARLLHLPTRLGAKPSLSKQFTQQTPSYCLSAASSSIEAKHGKRLDTSEASLKPWTGDDVEDQLSDQIIKDGLVSKPKVSNELGTAKAALVPLLKTNDGLQNLSRLFLRALTGRRNSNAIITPSTFKPPPRVTLTDARKTAWFADLANNTIPLRRLSRTIPHGVRGKFLLEQCCVHRVPTSRALWLAKCVGANELRAFKRKGVSNHITSENELRWVQEWTSHVLDFLWIALSGSRPSFTVVHAVHLVICVYAEGMIYHAQFLDGILERLETTPTGPLTLIFSIVKTWRAEFSASFRFHRRLLMMVEKTLPELHASPKTEYATLTITALEDLQRMMIEEAPSALLHHALTSERTKRNGGHQLDVSSPLLTSTQNSRDLSQILCTFLGGDHSRLDKRSRLLYALDHCADPQWRLFLRNPSGEQYDREYTLTVITWASTLYRAHKGAASIATSLLRRACEVAPNLRSEILAALFSSAADTNTSPPRLGVLSASLMAWKLVDVNAYMRAMIASGALYGGEGAACHLAIVKRLPHRLLSVQARNMHHQMVEALGGANGETSCSSDSLKKSHQINTALRPNITDDGLHEGCGSDSDVHASSPKQKLDLIMGALASRNADRQVIKLKPADEAKALCDILDNVDDPGVFLAILVPIIRAAGFAVLLPLTELICEYEAALALLAHFETLRGLLIARYRALRLVQPSHRGLVTLLQTFRYKEPWQERYLNEELRMCDQSQNVAANTPASDILTLNPTPPRSCEDTQAHQTRPDGPHALSQAHVEFLLKSDDTNVPLVTLLATSRFLKKGLTILRLASIRPELLVKLFCWIICRLSDDGEEVAELMFEVSNSVNMQMILIDTIVHQSDSVDTLLMEAAQSPLSARSTRCLNCIGYGLVYPCNGSGVLQHGSASRHNEPEGSSQALIAAVRDVLCRSTNVSSMILRVGLGILAHLRLLRISDPAALRDQLERQVEGSIRKGNTQWAEVISLFPQSLKMATRVREKVENAILQEAEHASSSKETTFDDMSLKELLDVMEQTSIWALRPIKVASIASRTLMALQAWKTGHDGRDPIQLQALLSLALLHHRSFDKDADQKLLISLLCELFTKPPEPVPLHIRNLTLATAGHFTSTASQSTIDAIATILPADICTDKDIRFLLGIRDDPYANIYLRSTATPPTKDPSLASTLAAFNLSSDDPTEPPHSLQPFEVKRWDMLPDASSKEGENDTPLGMRLFDTRKIG